MCAFKLFTGNYLTVLKNLGMPLSLVEKQSPASYDEDIAKDLHRIYYLNYRGNVEGMKLRLADHSNLSDEDLSYAQGNFFAGIFSRLKVSTLPKYLPKQMEGHDRELWREYSNGIDVHYVDDDGLPCGFSIIFLIDDQDTLPLERRQRHFAISIIKDVTNTPENRQVTYISHASLMHNFQDNNGPMPEKNGESLDTVDVARVLKAALNSKALSQLLTGIIQGESVDVEKFLALGSRIQPDRNIDDRDTKLNVLFDLYIVWARIIADKKHTLEKSRVGREIYTILNAAFTDVNFFKDKSIADVEQLVRSYQQHSALANLWLLPNALHKFAKHKGFEDYEAMQDSINQSFLRRNQGNLILLSVALLTTLSFTLVLTGALAPLGFVFLSTVLTELGLGTAGALTALSTVNLVLDEMDFSTNRLEVQQEVARLNAKEKREVAPLREQFQKRIENALRTQASELEDLDEETENPADDGIAKPVLQRVVSEPMLSVGRNRLTQFGKVRSVTNIPELEHRDDSTINEPSRDKKT